MFDKFTEKAIFVIMLAQEEARRLGHNHVGTEQMLLGLLRVPGGSPAGRALGKFPITVPAAREATEEIISRGSGFVEEAIPFTPNAKKLMESAWEIAQARKHNYIGTEHLLAALLITEDGTALKVLQKLNVRRSDIEKELEHEFGPPVEESGGALTRDALEVVRLQINIDLWKRRVEMARKEGRDGLVESAMIQVRLNEEKLAALEKRAEESGT